LIIISQINPPKTTFAQEPFHPITTDLRRNMGCRLCLFSLQSSFPGRKIPSKPKPEWPMFRLRLLASLLTFLFLALAQPSVARAGEKKSKDKPAKAKKSRNARAAAELEKIKILIDAGRRQEAIRRSKSLIRDFPGTLAATEALVILGTLDLG
jgi:hypothetical protein